MADVVIRGEGLSKLYRIGRNQERYSTLRDRVMETFTSPLRLFRGFHANGADNDTIWALRDVSFEVRRGEVLGVIGANGAGKSTLLKILSRITEPTAGYANIYGRVGALLEVGTGFHQELTGRENIYLNGAILGMRKTEIDRRFDEIVAFAEVEKFIDTPVKRYSSGMHVRLAFAVAAHLEPEILIIDEVLAVGDFAFQKKCLGKMHDVASGGRTVIFVSHNMGAVRTLCGRCLMLKDGEIAANGPSEEVIEEYIDQYTKAEREKQSDTIEPDRGEGFLLHRDDNGGDITIFCGDPLRIEFTIEAPSLSADKTAGIEVKIVSRKGDPIVTMSSSVQKVQGIHGDSQLWKVRCDMGSLPLNVGTYFAHVSAIIYRSGSFHSVAQFSNAIAIQVFENDVFGWGRSLPSPEYWGPMYWAPKWDIRPMELGQNQRTERYDHR